MVGHMYHVRTDVRTIHDLFLSAQPGVAYREAVVEPQVCLTNQRTFVYEITKKVVLNTMK